MGARDEQARTNKNKQELSMARARISNNSLLKFE